jgi:hypothetical protein
LDNPNRKRKFVLTFENTNIGKQMNTQPNSSSQRLNEQQMDMLRLFKNPMRQQDYDEIRNLAVKLLAQNIDEEMDVLEKKNGWNKDTYDQWGNEHLRTPPKK